MKTINFNSDVQNNLYIILAKFNNNLESQELRKATENFINKYKLEYRNKDLFNLMRNGYDNAMNQYRIWKDRNYRNIAKDWANNAAWTYIAIKLNIIH